MSDETVKIDARRLFVGSDLGNVRKGDHVLVVGDVVVALDTSRVPVGFLYPIPGASKSATPKMKAIAPPIISPSLAGRAAKTQAQRSEAQAKTEATHKRLIHITPESVLAVIANFEGSPTTTQICNSFGLELRDVPARQKVGRCIAVLRETGQIRTQHDVNSSSHPQHSIAKPAASALSPD